MSMISELIEELIDNADLHTKELHDLMYRAAYTIEMLSEKARGQAWTPCEERLPADGEWCLVSVSVNAINDIPYNIVISDKVSYCYERGWATAWMPLPEPYTKGEDDE